MNFEKIIANFFIQYRGIDFDGSTVGLAPIGVICSLGSCAVNQVGVMFTRNLIGFLLKGLNSNCRLISLGDDLWNK